MRWHDLLFMHWALDPDLIRPLVPDRLRLDLFEGMAWLGVVPFYMTGVGPRFLTWLPYLSAFVELNVRTYVTIENKPGVWFFSLDASNPVAVEAARRLFFLPYFRARMRTLHRDDWIYYRSRRTHRGASPATYLARYRPVGPVYHSTPGSLDYWLTERYALYAADPRGRIWRCEISHPQWPLQPAEAQVAHNTMTAQLGFDLPPEQPLLHFARCQDVVAWAPSLVAAAP
jgi:uncharacterized protein YqjF (DUF2071 family)